MREEGAGVKFEGVRVLHIKAENRISEQTRPAGVPLGSMVEANIL